MSNYFWDKAAMKIPEKIRWKNFFQGPNAS
jgi:hypothetical protein